MELTRKYKNPPLIEAICEFTFKESDISLSEIERDFEKAISNKFPNKRERKDINFIIGQKRKDEKIEHEIKETKGLTQFVSQDGVTMTQIGKNLLAINHLKPYNSWESFEPIIIDSLKQYLNCAKDPALERISIRYINKIDIPSVGIKMGEYFKYRISIPPEVSTSLSNVLVQTEHIYNSKDVLTILFHSTPPENNGKSGFVFDINYGTRETKDFDTEKLVEWLKVAHNSLNNVFENSLTDKCKSIFDL